MLLGKDPGMGNAVGCLFHVFPPFVVFNTEPDGLNIATQAMLESSAVMPAMY
jgi:hypothetical protein